MRRVFRLALGLLLCLLVVRNLIILRPKVSVGEYAYFVADSSERVFVGEGRPVILSIGPNGSLVINRVPWARDAFLSDMKAIYKTRCERVLFLTADANVPFGTVVDQIGQLHTILTTSISPSLPDMST